LMLLMEDHLEKVWKITNIAEAKRRQQRMAKQKENTQAQQRLWPQVLEWVVRLTQRSLKFIRWLRSNLLFATSLKEACPQLQRLYATL